MVARTHISQQVPGHLAPEDGWGHPAFGHLDLRKIRAFLSYIDLSYQARVLYALLLTHADGCGFITVPSDTIGEAVGCSADRIRYLMRELRYAGRVELVRRGAYTRPAIWRIVGVSAAAA